MINEDYSIGVDTEEYQSVLEHSMSKANFSVGTDIYMLPSNINLNVRKTAGYNNKILISNRNMKNRLNGNMSKAEVYHQKCFLSRYQRTRKKHMRPPCWNVFDKQLAPANKWCGKINTIFFCTILLSQKLPENQINQKQQY